ncbi:SaPosin-like Protein family [Ditylenchus destructor]|uniref:SaPosin-like Protein family n=1 Tax=Ditylenchus destructor TaxID=166010 RepID=A0AAD4MH04_9BILA|nr:SaPosin-like Protein family [Ditylenchus destructor]
MKLFVAIVLVAFGLFVVNADFDAKEELVKSNRIPKTAVLFSDACDECQLIVKRIADIAEDPTKIGELKMLLQLLCKEAPESYQDECRLFVAYVDKFLKELLPYLQNPHAVCHALHICGNKNIDKFHRVGMLYAKERVNLKVAASDLVCEECQFASNELKHLTEDKQVQAEVKQFLSENVCSRLGQYQDTCDKLLTVYLPDFWAELELILDDPEKVCENLKLCGPKTIVASESGKQKADKSTPRKVANLFINHFLKQ